VNAKLGNYAQIQVKKYTGFTKWSQQTTSLFGGLKNLIFRGAQGAGRKTEFVLLRAPGFALRALIPAENRRKE
jgi:hypothetical protein